MELLVFFLGVVTAILGYIFSNFVLAPIKKYYDVKAEIGAKLTYYSHIITSPGSSENLAKEAEPVIRGLAIDLERSYLSIPFREAFVMLKILPTNKTTSTARGQLILLSNSLDRGTQIDQNLEALAGVFVLLNIKELDNGHIVQCAKILNPNFKVE